MNDWQKKSQRVYEASDASESAQRYDEWADQYDQDIEEIFGNYSPRHAVETFVEYVNKDARILDAGAGTGLVGEVLAEYGYQNVEALELSQGMIEQARKKNVYSTIYQAALGEKLELPDSSYDAIIAKGVFAPGHAPANAFDELIRITRPGGYVVFTISQDNYLGSEYEQKVIELENRQLWKRVKKTEPYNAWPKATKVILHNIWVFQVMEK